MKVRITKRALALATCPAHLTPTQNNAKRATLSRARTADVLIFPFSKASRRKIVVPLYEYKCEKCGHKFEKIEKYSAPETRKCPDCGAKAHREISSSAIQFKGTGWYVTDYAGKNAAAKSGDSESKSSTKEDSSSAKKSDSAKESKSKESSSKESSSKDSSSKEKSKKN